MQDEALSDASGPAASGRRGLSPGLAVAGLLLLYFGVTSGVRWYVSRQIESVVGRPLPEFTLQDLEGKTWRASDFRGKKTLLNFFRSQCPSCRKEKAAITTLAAESGVTGVRVISVMMDKVEGFPEAATQATLAYFRYSHPVLMADAPFVEAFHGAGWAHVTPVTYVVDAKGVVTASLRGHQTLERLRAATQ